MGFPFVSPLSLPNGSGIFQFLVTFPDFSQETCTYFIFSFALVDSITMNINKAQLFPFFTLLAPLNHPRLLNSKELYKCKSLSLWLLSLTLIIIFIIRAMWWKKRNSGLGIRKPTSPIMNSMILGNQYPLSAWRSPYPSRKVDHVTSCSLFSSKIWVFSIESFFSLCVNLSEVLVLDIVA